MPVSAEEERYLKYAAPRGLTLLGFVDAASIPRHHYMKASGCLLTLGSCKGNASGRASTWCGATCAIAALAPR